MSAIEVSVDTKSFANHDVVSTENLFPPADVLKKVGWQYDPAEILNDFKKIEKLIDHRNQICVNSELNSEFSVEGPLYYNIGPIKDGEPCCENLNAPFKGLIFEKILRDLDCLTARTRIMRLSGRACYSFHWDTTPRFHLPILTNRNSFFYFDHHMPFHLPADGNVYWLDTRKPHTVFNCEMTPRYHLVIVDQKQDALKKGGYR